jgi:hypothetical protein
MTISDTAKETELLRSLRAQFDEFPRMRLTFEQAARLLAADSIACERTLRALLRSGYLAKEELVYRRADYCRV